MAFRAHCRSFLRFVFAYKTPRVIYVESIPLGIFYRLVQFLILVYIVGFAILYKKGYQDRDTALSTVTTKIKGISYNRKLTLPRDYRNIIFDPVDYVVPPHDTGSTFIMTNAIITRNQTQGVCHEDPHIHGAICTPSNNTCVKGQSLKVGNGIMTGRCIEVYKTGVFSCEIRAWRELTIEPLMSEAVNFTIFIKNFIEFPKFNVKRSNILNDQSYLSNNNWNRKYFLNASYLRNCIYDEVRHPFCPIFRVGDIISRSHMVTNFTQFALKGGIIDIAIRWDCNLDWAISYCVPDYRFSRLDTRGAEFARGWNFRYANFYSDNGVPTRDMYKAFGILFVYAVDATAGKFSIVPLLLNIGSGLALLTLASIACDFILIYVHKKRRYYYHVKYFKTKEHQALIDDDPVKLQKVLDEKHAAALHNGAVVKQTHTS